MTTPFSPTKPSTSFDAERAAALITTLADRGCQVIYLTDDTDVLGWAIGLPHETGGATTIPDARVRKPDAARGFRRH